MRHLNEAINELENASAIGLGLPPKLVDVLGQLKDGNGKEKTISTDDTESSD